jgi:hypothetical protein
VLVLTRCPYCDELVRITPDKWKHRSDGSRTLRYRVAWHSAPGQPDRDCPGTEQMV